MNKLIKHIVIISLAVLLGACASNPAYRQAAKGGNGYSDIKVSEDRYRVQYKSTSEDVMNVTNMALYRAAEITQLQGYDWFVVTSRETFVDRQSVEPQFALGVAHRQEYHQKCGLLGCQTSYGPVNSMDVELSNNRQRKEVQSILEVRLGKGMRPDENSYSASDLLENLATVTQS
ncbi:MAG: hypothetical protein NWQ54_24620 [Paraglaciecola sp.]|uniref:CC0125/CC1285 family lipoprotein n=1 Tax=Paraglaciecola sp. TaxID=1920173 RepID=UPI00273FDF55|nr:hypothetical protein [Paraglaciecola sp.]MDP5029302.1 hypothetical protein [Paraglaciecola sp.]MDP5134082.1 hypothetical protein [Paraglaciecola sp.]